MRLMSFRPRLLFLGSIAIAAAGVPTQGAAVTYSTSGTVAISNEPTARIVGVTGASLNVITPDHITIGPDGQSSPAVPEYSMGTIGILPVHSRPTPGQASNVIPDLSNVPFDIRISFNDPTVPTLDVKGAFRTGGPGNWDLFGPIATATSVTSSAPSLDANLPATFAGLLSGRDALDLHLEMWDWDVTKLSLVADVHAVPEPSSLVVFGAGAMLLGVMAHRRSSRGSA